MIELKLDEASGVWNESLREQLLGFAQLMDVPSAVAQTVLAETLERMIGDKFLKLRRIVIMLLEEGGLAAKGWQILMNRATDWRIPIERCERVVQQEAILRARKLIERLRARPVSC